MYYIKLINQLINKYFKPTAKFNKKSDHELMILYMIVFQHFILLCLSLSLLIIYFVFVGGVIYEVSV